MQEELPEGIGIRHAWILIDQGDKFLKLPTVIGQSSFRRGRDAQRLVNSAEVGVRSALRLGLEEMTRDNGSTFNGRHRANRVTFYQNALSGAGLLQCAVSWRP